MVDVIDTLQSSNIEYTIKEHQAEALTCELAAKERKCRISQIVKTMVAEDQQSNLYIALIPGDKILKLKKLRKEAGGIKIDLADPSIIAQKYNLIVGAISPVQFLNIDNVKFYVDPSVLKEEFVDISSGDPRSGLELKSQDLVELVNGKVCEIISQNS